MFTLDEVVPWGRSFDEYRRMFALTDGELAQKIIDCGSGPASFNAEATRQGAHVISCDPIYRWDVDQIRQRINSTCDTILAQTRQNRDEFVWDSIRSVEELGKIRMSAMGDFLNDYGVGRARGRYIDAELPTLPFSEGSFDLALSSHFLFLYTTQLGGAFHRAAVREMCRVATEVRIFPLLALAGRRSPYVDQIVEEFGRSGFDVSIEHVAYEFQRGGHEMMRIRPSTRARTDPPLCPGPLAYTPGCGSTGETSSHSGVGRVRSRIATGGVASCGTRVKQSSGTKRTSWAVGWKPYTTTW
jgi:hypothetical protein